MLVVHWRESSSKFHISYALGSPLGQSARNPRPAVWRGGPVLWSLALKFSSFNKEAHRLNTSNAKGSFWEVFFQFLRPVYSRLCDKLKFFLTNLTRFWENSSEKKFFLQQKIIYRHSSSSSVLTLSERLMRSSPAKSVLNFGWGPQPSREMV